MSPTPRSEPPPKRGVKPENIQVSVGKKPKESRHGRGPVWLYLDEVYARKIEERQQKYKNETHTRAKINKKLHAVQAKKLRAKIVENALPDWYQELATPQKSCIDNLQRAMIKDSRQNTICNVQESLSTLGIFPRPHHTKIQRALEKCSPGNSPITFLMLIYKFSKPQENFYTLNDRLLLSAVLHLVLPTILREMHVRLPSPPRSPKPTVGPQSTVVPCPGRKIKYKSPYLEPFTFEPEQPKYTRDYKSRYIQYPQNPYFSYLHGYYLELFLNQVDPDEQYPNKKIRKLFSRPRFNESQRAIEVDLDEERNLAQTQFDGMFPNRRTDRLLRANIYNPNVIFFVEKNPPISTNRTVKKPLGVRNNELPSTLEPEVEVIHPAIEIEGRQIDPNQATHSVIGSEGNRTDADTEVTEDSQRTREDDKNVEQIDEEETYFSDEEVILDVMDVAELLADDKDRTLTATERYPMYLNVIPVWGGITVDHNGNPVPIVTGLQRPGLTCKCFKPKIKKVIEVGEIDNVETADTSRVKKDKSIADGKKSKSESSTKGKSKKNLKGKSKDNKKGKSSENVKGKSKDNIKGKSKENLKGKSKDNIKGKSKGSLKGKSKDNIKGKSKESLKVKSEDKIKTFIYDEKKSESESSDSDERPQLLRRKKEPRVCLCLQRLKKQMDKKRAQQQLEDEEYELCTCPDCVCKNKRKKVEKVPSVPDFIPPSTDIYEKKDHSEKLVEIVEPPNLHCHCKHFIDQYIAYKEHLATHQAEQHGDIQKSPKKASHILGDLTKDGKPIIKGTLPSKECKCLEKYRKRIDNFERQNKIMRVQEGIKSTGKTFVIGGVKTGPDGKPIFMLSGTVGGDYPCKTCAEIKEQEEREKQREADMPILPVGTVKHHISGVKKTPTGNVYIISGTSMAEPCNCMKLYDRFMYTHGRCMQLFERYMEKIRTDTEQYLEEAKVYDVCPLCKGKGKDPCGGRCRVCDPETSSTSSGDTAPSGKPFVTNAVGSPYVKTETFPSGYPAPPPPQLYTGDTPEAYFPVSSSTQPRSITPSTMMTDVSDLSDGCICVSGKEKYIPEEEPVYDKLVEDQKNDDAERDIRIRRYFLVKQMPCSKMDQYKLVQNILSSMEADGYPLVNLPNAAKLPHFRIWMALRAHQHWTLKDRLDMAAYSKRYWEELRKAKMPVELEKLNFNAAQTRRFTFADSDKLKRMTEKIKERHYRKVKQTLISYGRDFFPSLFDYELPTPGFRDVYFAYVPYKEQVVFPRFPWAAFEYRNYSMMREHRKRLTQGQ